MTAPLPAAPVELIRALIAVADAGILQPPVVPPCPGKLAVPLTYRFRVVPLTTLNFASRQFVTGVKTLSRMAGITTTAGACRLRAACGELGVLGELGDAPATP